MSTSINRLAATTVEFSSSCMEIHLADGRRLQIALNCYPRLAFATAAELADVELLDNGDVLTWPALDEDIRVESLLAGRHSQESERSLAKWRSEMQRRREHAAEQGVKVNRAPWGRQIPLPMDRP